jgi:hypothetical protein
MKIIHTLVATSLAALVFSSAAQAMPPGRGGVYYPTLTKKSDFENVKPGEKLVLVCKNSDSIKVTDFKDKKQTMELCADGKMLHCTKCKREYRVTWNTPISKGGLPMYATKTVYEQGKPCMFVAKLK